MSTLYQAYTEPSTTILWIRYRYTQWAANINHLPAMASSNSNQLIPSFFSLRAYTYSIRVPPDDSCLDHRQEHNLGQSIHALAEKGQHGQLNSLGFLLPGYTLESPGDLFKHSGTRVHHRPIKSGWGLGELDIHILQSTLVDSAMKSRVSVMALEQWFSVWGLQNRSISISWKLVRNTDSQAPLQTYWIRNSGGGTQQSTFKQALQIILMHTKSEHHSPKALLLKVWSINQQHWNHLETCQKQNILPQPRVNQHFHISRQLVCTRSTEKYRRKKIMNFNERS